MPQLAEPEAPRILFAAGATQSGASAMDHQRAQITVAAFADAEQSDPSSTSLLRHTAQPSRELAAVLEAGSVTGSCNQCRRRYRPDAFDLAEALARLAVAEDFPYSAIIGCNSPLQFCQFLPQIPHERTHQLAEAVIAACHDLGVATSQLGDAPRDDAVLGKEGGRAPGSPA